MDFTFSEHPHRRYNALTGEWILVSPHRTKRPWQGKQERLPSIARPAHDPHCYLCPGNLRAGGVSNPEYEHTYVFDNDFAALRPETPLMQHSDDLFQYQSVQGTCRVICFSPRHDLTLPEMSSEAVQHVIRLWMSEAATLGRQYRWVQIFENKGEIMGCSNPHPHGQIWAGNFLPDLIRKEDHTQQRYLEEFGSVLLCDYISKEVKARKRLVVENESWAVVVPFWAFWPFETLLIPKRHIPRITDLHDLEISGLADILKSLLVKYDNLFQISFPYTMGWHGAPFGDPDDHWQLHAHFFPPLLRSASVQKFRVGYEMLAESQRDITAEMAAERLAELSTVHYRLREEAP